MRSRFVLRLATIAALAAVTGGLKCGEGPLDVGTGPVSTSVAGTWQGPIQDLTMRLVLAESGATVTGTGTMTQNGTPFTLTISGTNTNGTFSLQVNEAQHEPFTYTGTVQLVNAARTMVGVANGSGLTNVSVSLTRQ